MATTPQQLIQSISLELETVSDDRIVSFVRDGLIEPREVMRDWHYGDAGQQYPCWTVYEHSQTNSGVAYCESGHGPGNPWGLISPVEDRPSIGMDSEWFPDFLITFFDTFAVTTLPIWRVYEIDMEKNRRAISDECDWSSSWDKVMSLREENKTLSYDCYHSIKYGL